MTTKDTENTDNTDNTQQESSEQESSEQESSEQESSEQEKEQPPPADKTVPPGSETRKMTSELQQGSWKSWLVPGAVLVIIGVIIIARLVGRGGPDLNPPGQPPAEPGEVRAPAKPRPDPGLIKASKLSIPSGDHCLLPGGGLMDMDTIDKRPAPCMIDRRNVANLQLWLKTDAGAHIDTYLIPIGEKGGLTRLVAGFGPPAGPNRWLAGTLGPAAKKYIVALSVRGDKPTKIQQLTLGRVESLAGGNFDVRFSGKKIQIKGKGKFCQGLDQKVYPMNEDKELPPEQCMIPSAAAEKYMLTLKRLPGGGQLKVMLALPEQDPQGGSLPVLMADLLPIEAGAKGPRTESFLVGGSAPPMLSLIYITAEDAGASLESVEFRVLEKQTSGKAPAPAREPPAREAPAREPPAKEAPAKAPPAKAAK